MFFELVFASLDLFVVNKDSGAPSGKRTATRKLGDVYNRSVHCPLPINGQCTDIPVHFRGATVRAPQNCLL